MSHKFIFIWINVYCYFIYEFTVSVRYVHIICIVSCDLARIRILFIIFVSILLYSYPFYRIRILFIIFVSFLSIYRFIDLSIYRFIDLSIYRFIDLSIYRFIDLSIYAFSRRDTKAVTLLCTKVDIRYKLRINKLSKTNKQAIVKREMNLYLFYPVHYCINMSCKCFHIDCISSLLVGVESIHYCVT
jgi:hypothetical protein